ncbi:DUF1120 domain-containing protein [Burkholderia pyrrocinia]
MKRDTERRRAARTTVIAIGLLLSSAAFAETPPSTDLAVTGQILPGACKVTAANGGTIDYGIISAATGLNKDSDTQLQAVRLEDALEIHCAAATRISLTVSDNRQGSAGGNTTSTGSAGGYWVANAGNGAGLGFDSGGHRIGGYAGTISSWTADNKGVTGAVAPGGSGGVVYNYAGLPGTHQGDIASAGNGATYVFTQSGTIVSAQDYSMSLEVAADIAPAKTLTLDRPVRLDGSMSFQLNYL